MCASFMGDVMILVDVGDNSAAYQGDTFVAFGPIDESPTFGTAICHDDVWAGTCWRFNLEMISICYDVLEC